MGWSAVYPPIKAPATDVESMEEYNVEVTVRLRIRLGWADGMRSIGTVEQGGVEAAGAPGSYGSSCIATND